MQPTLANKSIQQLHLKCTKTDTEIDQSGLQCKHCDKLVIVARLVMGCTPVHYSSGDTDTSICTTAHHAVLHCSGIAHCVAKYIT
jgi:hypothetical protein